MCCATIRALVDWGDERKPCKYSKWVVGLSGMLWVSERVEVCCSGYGRVIFGCDLSLR